MIKDILDGKSVDEAMTRLEIKLKDEEVEQEDDQNWTWKPCVAFGQSWRKNELLDLGLTSKARYVKRVLELGKVYAHVWLWQRYDTTAWGAREAWPKRYVDIGCGDASIRGWWNMIEELLAEIDNWRAEYMHLGRELRADYQRATGYYFKIAKQNRRLKRENWNLKKTKGWKKWKNDYITKNGNKNLERQWEKKLMAAF